MEMFPIVTKPTKITHNMASFIGNIDISGCLLRDYISGILIDDISDNLPCTAIIIGRLRISKEPTGIEYKKFNEENINIL